MMSLCQSKLASNNIRSGRHSEFQTHTGDREEHCSEIFPCILEFNMQSHSEEVIQPIFVLVKCYSSVRNALASIYRR